MIGGAILLYIIWFARPRLLDAALDGSPTPFDLFTAGVYVALVIWIGRDLLQNWVADPSRLITKAAFGITCLFFLDFFNQYHMRSWDFNVYLDAAKAVIGGENPYTGRYLYPPPPAEALAALLRISHWLNSVHQSSALLTVEDETAALYFYQVMQLALVMGAWVLSRKFLMRLGVGSVLAALIASTLLIVSPPLLMTLKYNQMNLWVLNAILAAALLTRSDPASAGLIAAIGVDVKVYPLIMLPVWIASRRWKALAALLIALVAVIGLDIIAAGGIHLWRDYYHFAQSAEGGNTSENTSLMALAFRLPTLFGISGEAFATLSNALGVVLYLSIMGVVLVIALRGFQKLQPTLHNERAFLRFTAYATAVMLLVSPMVWHHHYLAALPVILVLVDDLRRKIAPLPVTALLLVQFLPVIEVFPMNHLRQLGLLLFILHLARSEPPEPVTAMETADVTA